MLNISIESRALSSTSVIPWGSVKVGELLMLWTTVSTRDLRSSESEGSHCHHQQQVSCQILNDHNPTSSAPSCTAWSSQDSEWMFYLKAPRSRFSAPCLLWILTLMSRWLKRSHLDSIASSNNYLVCGMFWARPATSISWMRMEILMMMMMVMVMMMVMMIMEGKEGGG